MDDSNNLVWIDCEFTSLDFQTNRLVETACVVTDSDLRVLGEPVVYVIGFGPDELQPLLSDWTREHFAESGLIEKIHESSVTVLEAENSILEYVSQYCEPGTAPLAGNSVGADRRMLYKEMSELERYLHHRTVDVSTIKELARRWKPEILESVVKKKTHRALDDIYESIEELRVYKQLFN